MNISRIATPWIRTVRVLGGWVSALLLVLPILAQQPAFLTDGLLAYYPLNGSATDASGKGHNGSVLGGLTFGEGRFGVNPGAAVFNGTSTSYADEDRVEISNLQAGTTTTWSASAWVRLAKSKDTHTVFSLADGSGLYLRDDALLFFWYPDRVEVGAKVRIPKGEWMQVAVTSSGKSFTVFLNGQALNTVEHPADFPAVSFAQGFLGGRGYGSANYTLDGALEQVRFWGKPLSGAEIGEVYKYEKNREPYERYLKVALIKPAQALNVALGTNSVTFNGNIGFTIAGPGLIEWPSAFNQIQPGDIAEFVYEELSGDFDKSVCLSGIVASPSDAWASGGLAARVDLGALSPSFMVNVGNPSGVNEVRTIGRALEGQEYTTFSRIYSGVDRILPNQWVRLRRVGNWFASYVGTNGVDWSLIGQRYQEWPSKLIVGPYAFSASYDSNRQVGGSEVSRVTFNNYGDTTIADQKPPSLISAGTIDKKTVGIRFSEPMASVTSLDSSNYSLSQGTITGVKAGIGGDSVYLTVTGVIADEFEVVITGLMADVSGNLLPPNSRAKVRVSPWKSTDIGFFQSGNREVRNPGDDPFRISQAVATSSGDSETEIEIIGGGSNGWNPGDFCHYLQGPVLDGDFDVTAEISRNDRPANTENWGHSGLMMRESEYLQGLEHVPAGTKVKLVANTAYIEGATPNRAAIPIWRENSGGGYGNGNPNFPWTRVINGIKGYYLGQRSIDAGGTIDPESSDTSSRWLRMVRLNGRFMFYTSYDGEVWVPLDPDPKELPLQNRLIFGFYTTNDTGAGEPPDNAYPGNGFYGTDFDGRQNVSNYSVQRIRIGFNVAPRNAALNPPTVLAQPSGETVANGGTAKLGVTATGSAPLSYQWSKDGNALPGATNATLTFTNVQPPRIGDYRVVVSNGAGSVTSSVATLNIQGVDAGIWKGLVAYYPFNGNAKDESGNANDGKENRVFYTVDRFGRANTSILFKETSLPNSVVITNRLFSSGQNEFSTAVWVLLPDISEASQIGTILNTRPHTGYGLGFGTPNHPGEMRFALGTGLQWVSVEQFQGFSGWNQNVWKHVVFTKNKDSVKLFSDGKLLGTYTVASTFEVDCGLLIGSSSHGDPLQGTASYNFQGVLDDIRIYNRALSDADVAALYASEAPQPPSITVQPEGRTVGLGETVSFGVTATGSAPLSYQWTKDGNALPGATNATLTFTNVQPSRIGDYLVVVSNGAGSVTSSVATLNIQGVDAGIWKGLVAYYPLAGDARDNGVFRLDGQAFGGVSWGVNRNSLQNGAAVFNGKDSGIEVTNSSLLGAESMTISQWVFVNAMPTTDRVRTHLIGKDGDFSRGQTRQWVMQLESSGSVRAAVFKSQSPSWGSVIDSNFKLEPGKWYNLVQKWNDSTCSISINGISRGSVSAFGGLLQGSEPIRIGGTPIFQHFFNGLISDVRIYNRALSDAEIATLYAFEAPQPPSITVQPEGRTVGLGETVSFGVTATGSAPLSYQWSKDGNALPGATNATLTFTNVQPPRIGDYRVVVSNGAGSVTSSVAALNIQGVDAGIWKGLVGWYPLDGDGQDGSSFGNDAVFGSVSGYRDRHGNNDMAILLSGDLNSFIRVRDNGNLTKTHNITVSTWLQLNQGGDNNPRIFSKGWSPNSLEAYLVGVSANPRQIEFFKNDEHKGSGVRSSGGLVLGKWCFLSFTHDGSLMRIFLDGVLNAEIVNDIGFIPQNSIDLYFGGNSQTQFDNLPGVFDDIRIYNRALSDAEVAALYAYESTPPVPTVVTAPVDQTLVAGQTLSLTAQISGSNLSYRWQKDGADLADGGRVSGASTPTLTITGVTPADAGQYRLTASNANGNAATAAATVAVRVPPAITQQPQSVDGIEGDAVTLSVSVIGAPTPTFQWFKNGQALDGQTAATLEFLALKESDAGTYRVVVSNPAGSVTSSDAVLTYTPAIRVLADGVAVREVVRTLLPVTVDLQFARNDWFLFYSLDGSEPTFASESFLVPFVVGQASVLRVVAYSPDFSQSVVSAPVTFRFLQPQSISWDAVPTLQYQQQGTVGVSASSGLPVVLSVVSGPVTLSGNQLTATGVGDVLLRAVQVGSDAFASVTSERTLTVTQAQQTLTWPTLASRIFGEAAFPVVVTASSGLPVTLAVTSGKATVSGTSVTLTGAGSVTLTATQAGDANRAEVSESKTFAVAKADQTLTFPSLANRPYTPEPFVAPGTASSGLVLALEVLSGPAVVEAGKLRLTGVGSVVVRATQPGNADYNAALPVDRTFTVSQGTQTLTFTPVGAKTFGDAPVTLSATSSAGLVVTFRVLSGPGTVSGNLLTLSGAGTLVLQALQAGTDLYAAASASQNVVVAKADQTLTFSALSDTGYTTSVLPLVASASSGLPVTFRVVSGPATVSGSELRLTGVGAVSVAADQAGTGNYLAATSVTRSFTVSRGAQEITFTSIGDQVLGSPAVTLSATSSSGLSVAFQVISGPATVIGNQLTLLNEGTVVVRARQAGSPLWLTAQVDQTFQIKKLTTLTLSAATGGSITVDPVKERYDPKDVVTLQATASDGYQFAGWSGDLTGTANPTTLLMAANRTVGATFKDIAAPVLTWDLPVAGTTGNEQAVLSGRVTDNAPGVTATWRRDGGVAEALPLATDGSFRVEGLKLAPGANTFAVTATDAAGTVTTLERIVTWVPERVLQVSTAAEVQEGQRMVFPVDLAVDAANVAGLTFRLGFDPSALTDPQVEWGALVGQSVNNVNILPGGEINATFSLAGSALPVGTNRIATVSFRARSVPGPTNTVLSPTIVSLGTPTGAALTTGNAVVSGTGRILPRRIKGDNNANQRIDVGDAVVISRLQVGLEELRPWDVALNDLNATGSIDNGDVIKALRYVVGLDAQPKAAPRVGGELSVERGALRGEGAGGAGAAEGVGPGVGWALSRPVPQGTAAPTDAGLRPAGEGGGVSGIETRSSLSEAGLNPQLSTLSSQPSRRLRPAGSNTNDVAILEFPDGPIAQVGKPYRVVVKLTRAGAAIAGLSFTVNYPSALTLTDKQVGALVPADALPLWAESVGSVNLAAVRSTVWPTSTGVAAVLTFLPTAAINSQALWPIELVKGEVTGAGFDIRALDNVTGEIRSASTPPVEPKVVVPTLPMEGGPLALDVEAAAGAAIVLETTTDLGSWSEAQRLTGQGAGKPVRVTVTPDPNARARFWRVRVP